MIYTEIEISSSPTTIHNVVSQLCPALPARFLHVTDSDIFILPVSRLCKDT